MASDQLHPAWSTTSVARQALAAFPPRLRGSLRLAARSGNATWRVTTDSGSFALRLYRPGRWTAPQILVEHSFMRYLSASLPVELPRRGRNGETVQQVTDPDTGKPVYAALFPWVPGRHQSDRIRPQHLVRAGVFLADLHRAARGFRAPTSRVHLQRRHMFGPVVRFCQREWQRLLPEAPPLDLDTPCQRAAATWAKLSPATGYLHGDLHWGNFKTAGQELYPVDFDDCGPGPLAYDLAVLAYWTDESPEVPDPVELLVEAYNSSADRPVRPEAVRFFVWVRNLWVLAWILARPEQYPGPELLRDARCHALRLGALGNGRERPYGLLA